MNKKLGIYVHIPFCRSKCNYCDFYSLSGSEASFDSYEEALKIHIRESAELLTDRDVDTVYFGGGTPTHFGAKRLSSVLNEIAKRFYLEQDAEITFEANPESVDSEDVLRLRRTGFNRISLGVQCSDNYVLKLLGRPHTWERSKRAVHMCKEAGLQNLSIDLMYGLPGQTLKKWESTLEDIMALAPEHISCYGLKIEEGTPFAAQREELELPDEDVQADMYIMAVERLGANGFGQYEISNFAKRGFASRHNLKYWTLQEYLGFGAAAHSDLDGRRFACVRDMQSYITGIRGGKKVMTDLEIIPQKARAGEYIMLGLRTVRGISAEEYTLHYGEGFEKLRPYLRKLTSAGFVREIGERIHLTTKGFLVSNVIIGGLLEYL